MLRACCGHEGMLRACCGQAMGAPNAAASPAAAPEAMNLPAEGRGATLRMQLQPAFRCSSLNALDPGSGREIQDMAAGGGRGQRAQLIRIRTLTIVVHKYGWRIKYAKQSFWC